MVLKLNDTIQPIRYNSLLFFGKRSALALPIIAELVDKLIDVFKGIARRKQVADIIDPLRVLLRSLITNFKFVLKRAIGNDYRLLIIF